MPLDKWKVLSQKTLIDAPFFSLKVDKCELPDKRIMPKYYIFEFADWVNVVPITEDNQIILIRQYRHATASVYYEIPGGTTHPGQNEDPLLAAKRELLEETGFESPDWSYRGAQSPNPALQSNKMHTYLARNCIKVTEQNLDAFEEIEVELFQPKDVVQMLKSGQIEHSLIAASLVRCLDDLK